MVAASPPIRATRSTLEGTRPVGARTLLFDVRRVTTLLWLATAFVLGLGILREIFVHLVGTETVLKDLRHFALDAERSLPAWYESFTMLAAAGLLTILAILSAQRDRRDRVPWTLLALIFLLMAVDEVVSIHEVSIAPLRDKFNLTGIFYFSWVILAAPVLLVLAIYFIPFLLRLPRRTALAFCAAGAMFVGGAFGLELLGGHYASIGGFEYLPYKIAAATEECLELTGMTLFVCTLLQHVAEVAPLLEVVMRDSA